MLVNDISARVQLGLDDNWLMPLGRVINLLVRSNADPLSQVRAAAAMGAMIQPVTWGWVDLDSAMTRAVLVEAGVGGSRRTARGRVEHGPQRRDGDAFNSAYGPAGDGGCIVIRRPRGRGLRYRYRLVAAMLLVSLPLMVVLAVLLTTSASSSLTASAEDKGESVARSLTLRVEEWVADRQASVAVLAAAASGPLAAKDTGSALGRVDDSYRDFSLIELTDLNGKVLTTSRGGAPIDVAGQDWFKVAAGGQPVVSSLYRQGDQIRWIVAQPVLDRSGRPAAVVVGDLNPTVLTTLLNVELSEGNEVVVVDAEHRLLYSSDVGEVADDAGLLAAGVLSTAVENSATERASSTGESGVARFIDLEGHDVIGGYDVVENLNWVVVAQDEASTVLAPVIQQRNAPCCSSAWAPSWRSAPHCSSAFGSLASSEASLTRPRPRVRR